MTLFTGTSVEQVCGLVYPEPGLHPKPIAQCPCVGDSGIRAVTAPWGSAKNPAVQGEGGESVFGVL